MIKRTSSLLEDAFEIDFNKFVFHIVKYRNKIVSIDLRTITSCLNNL